MKENNKQKPDTKDKLKKKQNWRSYSKVEAKTNEEGEADTE